MDLTKLSINKKESRSLNEFQINPISKFLDKKLRNKINLKTKPIGSLGELENIAIQIGLVQNSMEPKLNNPTILLFAGDHGISEAGVSPYPQEVTHQMVYNILSGGAAISIFANQNEIDLHVIDSGVNHYFENISNLINAKVGLDTANFLIEPAMNKKQLGLAISRGCQIIDEIYKQGCNIIGFGEMGISNSSAASLIMKYVCNLNLQDCVGSGSGVNENQLVKKIDTLKEVIKIHANHLILNNAESILSTFGGFEIAMMCGAMLRASELGMILMIDGFISTAALLIAQYNYGNIVEYCIFAHQSDEKGHKMMLDYLNVKPLLNINMRLGEGSGIAVSFPLIKSAVTFLNDMASFDEAKVTNIG